MKRYNEYIGCIIFAYWRKASTILIGTLLIASIAYSQPLNGVYSVGSTSSNYISISDAVADLNLNGVSAPVTFNIAPGIYQEQVVISAISGASPINTITFQSSSLDSSAVIMQYNSYNSATNFVIRLDAAEYIHIKYMTLFAQGDFYKRALVLSSGSSNNIFSNNVFKSNTQYTCTDDRLLVYCYGGLTNFNIIQNNRFENGLCQLKIVGTESNPNIGNSIKNNLFEGNASLSILISWQQDIVISNNIINGYRSNYIAAIGVYYCSENILIEKNKINVNGSYSYIIFIEQCNGSTNSPILFKNNFITRFSCGYSSSLYLNSSSNLKVLNNSFNDIDNGNDKLVKFGSDLTNIELFNNIFKRNEDGYFYFLSELDTTQIHSDWNAFYTTGTMGFDINDNNISLTEWQNTTSQDLHSIFTNFLYDSVPDLHISNSPTLNHAGISLADVLVDIDNEPRDLIAPDIGADEFDIDSTTLFDIQLVNIFQSDTTSCEHVDSLIFEVINHSNFQIDSFEVKYSLFGLLIDTVTVFNFIQPYDTIHVNLGAFDFAPNTYYEFEFEISKPNGQLDNNYNNNTKLIQYSYLDNAEIFKKTNSACNDNIELYIKEFHRESVIWSNGSTQNSIIISNPDTYSVTVIDNKGCTVSDTIIID